MRDESKWGQAKISDLLESMTTSRTAYSTIRQAIFAACRLATPSARRLSAWNRLNMAGQPLLGDQVSVPTKRPRVGGCA